jgi:putative PIN family toxin of toxin-antitoxin system
MRVFFDASIIIAALLSPTGGSALLFQFIKTGRITGVTSQTVIDEVLEEDKPRKINKTKQQIAQFVANSGLLVRDAISLNEIEPYQQLIDREDAHLIAGAILTTCSHLVSLDKKHVLTNDVRERFLPLVILGPKELLEKLDTPHRLPPKRPVPARPTVSKTRIINNVS